MPQGQARVGWSILRVLETQILTLLFTLHTVAYECRTENNRTKSNEQAVSGKKSNRIKSNRIIVNNSVLCSESIMLILLFG